MDRNETLKAQNTPVGTGPDPVVQIPPSDMFNPGLYSGSSRSAYIPGSSSARGTEGRYGSAVLPLPLDPLLSLASGFPQAK